MKILKYMKIQCMAKGGFSWKRAAGISKAKNKLARKTGIPSTKAGFDRTIRKKQHQGA